MEVVVGSESALKLRAVVAAFQTVGLNHANVSGIAVESGMGIQPVGTRQMEDGARTRARNAHLARPGADFYVGIENGLVRVNGNWFDPTCVVVLAPVGHESTAFGAYFPVPRWMATRTLEGKSELGEVVKELAGGGEKDPMKYLSQGTIPREELLAQAVHCALVPLFNLARYEEH